MSTRGEFIFKSYDRYAVIYHHYDMYPEGAFKTLVEFLGEESIGKIFNKAADQDKIYFGPSANPDDWNDYADLEWVYFIDLEKKTVTAYRPLNDEGWAIGSAADALNRPAINLKEYRRAKSEEYRKAKAALNALGFKVKNK